MRTALRVIALIAVAMALAWEFVPFQVEIWDGGIDLTVNLSSTAGDIRYVRCKACVQREDAEWALENWPDPEAWSGSVVVDRFDGKPFPVYVPITGRDSPLGREISRRQHRFLAVIGNLQDGRRIGKLVELPDLRKSREVSVSLP